MTQSTHQRHIQASYERFALILRFIMFGFPKEEPLKKDSSINK